MARLQIAKTTDLPRAWTQHSQTEQ